MFCENISTVRRVFYAAFQNLHSLFEQERLRRDLIARQIIDDEAAETCATLRRRQKRREKRMRRRKCSAADPVAASVDRIGHLLVNQTLSDLFENGPIPDESNAQCILAAT